MTWTIDNKFKTRALDGALDIFDEGSADATGDVRLLTAADAELALVLFSNPAFGVAAMNGAVSEASANAMTDDATVAAGTIGKVQVRDRDNTARLAGTVGLPASGADLIISNTTIPAGAEFVGLEALTFAFAWAQ